MYACMYVCMYACMHACMYMFSEVLKLCTHCHADLCSGGTEAVYLPAYVDRKLSVYTEITQTGSCQCTLSCTMTSSKIKGIPVGT